MRIGDICEREVVHCTRHASVAEIAKLMRNHHVGDVIVVEPQGADLIPVGIVTDRDLVVEVLAPEVGIDTVVAQDLMSGELATMSEDETVDNAIAHMRSRGVRRLPVVNVRRALVGVLTDHEVTAYLAEQLGELARLGHQQIAVEKAWLNPVAG